MAIWMVVMGDDHWTGVQGVPEKAGGRKGRRKARERKVTGRLVDQDTRRRFFFSIGHLGRIPRLFLRRETRTNRLLTKLSSIRINTKHSLSQARESYHTLVQQNLGNKKLAIENEPWVRIVDGVFRFVYQLPHSR